MSWLSDVSLALPTIITAPKITLPKLPEIKVPKIDVPKLVAKPVEKIISSTVQKAGTLVLSQVGKIIGIGPKAVSTVPPVIRAEDIAEGETMLKFAPPVKAAPLKLKGYQRQYAHPLLKYVKG